MISFFFSTVLMVFLSSSSQEYLVPEEYVKMTRESILNRCLVSSYDQVCDVIKKELRVMPDEVCSSLSFFSHGTFLSKVCACFCVLCIFFLELIHCYFTLTSFFIYVFYVLEKLR